MYDHTEDDLRRAVETRDEVRSDLAFVRFRRRSELQSQAVCSASTRVPSLALRSESESGSGSGRGRGAGAGERGLTSQILTILRALLTSILSGLISACIIWHFAMWPSAISICLPSVSTSNLSKSAQKVPNPHKQGAGLVVDLQERTAAILIPTPFPYFLMTSRRFASYFSNTKHRWPLCLKWCSNLTMCFLSSGSVANPRQIREKMRKSAPTKQPEQEQAGGDRRYDCRLGKFSYQCAE